MNALVIYALLAATTTLYTMVINHYKAILEPDFTWLEVIVGVMFCLAAAALVVRTTPGGGSWRMYEAAVWMSFVVGGAPVVVWHIARMIIVRDEVIRYERTKALAQKRRSRTG